MTTITTLLSGGEGVGCGARAAGITHLQGFEYDDAIAQVARDNGFNVITADVMSLDPTTLPIPDILHASPVCKRASGANQSAELNEDGTKEAPEDIAMGEKIAQFIDVMTPRTFTLENVFQYRTFKAFKTICAALSRNGYMWDFDNLNSADYGVPQTRRRLILRAVRGALLPNLPQPEKWVGWHESILDLIPTLPDSQFAPWQLERLPFEVKETAMLNRNQSKRDDYPRLAPEPAYTVCAEGSNGRTRAFIVDCQKAGDTNGDRLVTLRQGDEPMFTVTNGKGNRQPVRAYLVSDHSKSAGEGVQVVDDSSPFFSIRAGENGGSYPKALLISSIDCTAREDQEPANTIVATGDGHSIPPRAWLSQGRVVSMTPRALCRFQSIPDSYILPGNKKLACVIIGNAVPPLMIEKLYRQIIEA